MKLVVIGLGQCGGRIADEFARLNKKAMSQRGIEIITGCFAVNSDAADLSGLTSIKRDYQHRIIIGSRKTGGHGVGKINELGAEIARDDADKVIDAIRTTKRFYETDAFLLIASSGGGTGSGSIPVMTQHVKERYSDKPVYSAIILPFEQQPNSFANVKIDFKYFFIRKVMFVKYAAAYVILPGGFGTLDELFEAVTLVQTHRIKPFPLILDHPHVHCCCFNHVQIHYDLSGQLCRSSLCYPRH